ncbi:response regulator [Nocardiopsis changdeensis]|uniref:Response regulator transcription factor n=1 Tax=Nocardiopsis changdeensis TaxID=2831969 RepID=A0ABX8BQV6_9ACTN|nr:MULTISPECIES: response regulator transcription factor [Nocardiopsis]QUX23467.1 response regulator transcription factor [Nocardiopsis changdeensis]QYX39411.1 response regulator transcription factor [Nocardiopsis sp. MT53]
MKLFLVDDHPIVRAGLAALFEGEEDIEIVGEAADGTDAVRLIGLRSPNVVLMDLRLEGGLDGVAVTERVLALPAPPRVLVLTTYENDGDIMRALDAGASGYLLKDSPPERLFEAVRAAARGETVLSPHVAARLVRRVRDPRPAVTPRELEILRLLAKGAGNREIARTLFVTEATVKTHLQRIYAKLGVETRTAAVRAAVDLSLISWD